MDCPPPPVLSAEVQNLFIRVPTIPNIANYRDFPVVGCGKRTSGLHNVIPQSTKYTIIIFHTSIAHA